jgi:hypothetical protein
MNDLVCKDGRFHDYSITLGEDDTLLVERCSDCHREIRFPKVNGKVDNKRYGQTHLLYFLQPSHPEYTRYYKLTKPHKKPKSVAEHRDEVDAFLKEELHFSRVKYYT